MPGGSAVWIKYLGAAFILAAAVMWGNLQAAKLRDRTRNWKSLDWPAFIGSRNWLYSHAAAAGFAGG